MPRTNRRCIEATASFFCAVTVREETLDDDSTPAAVDTPHEPAAEAPRQSAVPRPTLHTNTQD